MEHPGRLLGYALALWLVHGLGAIPTADAQTAPPSSAPPATLRQEQAQQRLARDKLVLERRAQKSIRSIDLNLPALTRRAESEHGEARKRDKGLETSLSTWRKRLEADLSRVHQATLDTWDGARLAIERDIVATDEELQHLVAP
jgi:hypothetical protein